MSMHSVVLFCLLLVVVPIYYFIYGCFSMGCVITFSKKKTMLFFNVKNYACDLLVFADSSLWK